MSFFLFHPFIYLFTIRANRSELIPIYHYCPILDLLCGNNILIKTNLKMNYSLFYFLFYIFIINFFIYMYIYFSIFSLSVLSSEYIYYCLGKPFLFTRHQRWCWCRSAPPTMDENGWWWPWILSRICWILVLFFYLNVFYNFKLFKWFDFTFDLKNKNIKCF